MVWFCLAVPRDERMTIGEQGKPKRERNAAKEGTRAEEEEEEEEGAKKSLPSPAAVLALASATTGS